MLVLLFLFFAGASATACNDYKDCGSCIKDEDIIGHDCEWCTVDQQCHALGSSDSSCYNHMEDDHCVSLQSSSLTSCTLKVCPPASDAVKPQQLHLALAGPTGMRITWKTDGKPSKCAVTVSSVGGGLHTGRSFPTESMVQYLKGHGYHHVALLQGLSPGNEYDYTCVCDGVNAEVRRFQLPATDLAKGTILVMGDMGFGETGQAFASRQRMEILAKSMDTDLTIHVGDVGYADDSLLHGSCAEDFCYEASMDGYMTWMENLTDTKPYMVLPGNHESECHSPNCVANRAHREALRNFSAFNARWSMPSKESGGVLSMWYSWDYGPIHFVSLNTETDFPDAPEGEHGDAGKIFGAPSGHFAPDGEYLKWLEADLKAADSNRAKRPWVVAMGHRTWIKQYNQEKDPAVKAVHAPLFEKYNVDLYLTGHVHAYSRHLPLSGSGNGKTAIVVTGAAGCDEGLEGFDFKKGVENGWDYLADGKTHQVGTLEFTRESLTWKAYKSETGDIIDSFTLNASVRPTEALV